MWQEENIYNCDKDRSIKSAHEAIVKVREETRERVEKK